MHKRSDGTRRYSTAQRVARSRLIVFGVFALAPILAHNTCSVEGMVRQAEERAGFPRLEREKNARSLSVFGARGRSPAR